MPSAAIGAGISAVGSVAGGAIAGKGAKKAAKLQAATADKQMAQAKAFYDDSVARYQPDIDRGNTAASNYNALLGLGGDTAAANTAYDTWKGATGYQTTMNDALKGVNASAYAAGMGRSGAALKALQDRAAQIANGTFQSYLGNVNTEVQTGAAAKAALSGAGQTQLATTSAATQNAGNAASNAALVSGSATSTALQNLGNLAGNYVSSYGLGSSPKGTIPATPLPPMYSPVVLNSGRSGS